MLVAARHMAERIVLLNNTLWECNSVSYYSPSETAPAAAAGAIYLCRNPIGHCCQSHFSAYNTSVLGATTGPALRSAAALPWRASNLPACLNNRIVFSHLCPASGVFAPPRGASLERASIHHLYSYIVTGDGRTDSSSGVPHPPGDIPRGSS